MNKLGLQKKNIEQVSLSLSPGQSQIRKPRETQMYFYFHLMKSINYRVNDCLSQHLGAALQISQYTLMLRFVTSVTDILVKVVQGGFLGEYGDLENFIKIAPDAF